MLNRPMYDTKKGIFGGTFLHLTVKSDKEDVAKWTQALQEVASLKGWDSKTAANGYEGELVELVVTRVLSELKKAFQLVVTEQLVGIDNAVGDVLRLLDDKLSTTRIVGIHGMGGIGKTTLAKVVYNKLSNQFQDCSFIADIWESSKHKGISCLQNQLILDILKGNDHVSNTDEGIRIMESRFKSKKFLILLDDVDEIDQLEALVGKHDWFKMGSRIIITTRKKSVLDDAEVNCKYELKEMTKDQSLILFSRHAFRRNSPLCGYESLSHEVVTTTGGLPLALEVVGSFLCGKKQASWQDTLDELKEVPHEKVQKKLRISYEALNYKEKQIFLDIACFFIGIDSRLASYMWDDCNLRSARGIERLSLMSLIKIGDNHELRMHDQLRDLGREIARQEDYGDLLNRSRLWVYEEALDVLQTNRENGKVKALRLDKHGSSKFMEQESVKRMPNLTFLHVSAGDFAGDLEISLSKLRWLKWERYPDSFKMTNVHLENLLIIELLGGNIHENWVGWSLIKMERLKVLNLSGCSQLKTTPNLSTFKSLEMLILEDCPNLKEIHHSVGHVTCLFSLNLNICKRLRRLPVSLEALGKLQQLSLVCCYSLREISFSIEKLGELVELDLSYSGIKTLPDIEKLKKLEILRISRSKIKRLPSAIGKLESLRELDASGCRKLEGEILVDKGGSSSLRTLRLGGANISRLPENFRELSTLEHLDLLYCSELESLPEPPSRLSSLQLTCRSLTLPSLSHLMRLKTLTLHLCRSLESIPELPSYIQTLRVSECSKLKTLPNLSNLKFLLELELLRCYGLMEFNGLEGLKSLRKLDVSISSESSKRDGLEDLEELRYSNLQRHDQEADNLRAIQGLGQLISLEELNISARKHIQQLDLSKSEHLKRLIVNNCESLVEIRCHDKIESLEHFDRDGCMSLEKIPDFLAHDKS